METFSIMWPQYYNFKGVNLLIRHGKNSQCVLCLKWEDIYNKTLINNLPAVTTFMLFIWKHIKAAFTNRKPEAVRQYALHTLPIMLDSVIQEFLAAKQLFGCRVQRSKTANTKGPPLAKIYD